MVIHMNQLQYINLAIIAMFAICLAYQMVYMLVAIIKSPKKFTSKQNHRYAVVIAARNESNVIHQLIESIKNQNYPQELIDVFVIADNCTDNTADVAKNCGAIVYERFNQIQVGKGYALDYLFEKIKKDYSYKNYEAYIVFDADNILDENYVAEINKVFDNGYNVVTSYRNSKNFTQSWISSGYSLWFLKEAKFLNNPRMILKNSCAVSGTGFLVATKTIEKLGGWKFFTLTEDIEFTFNRAEAGDLIGYAHDAIFYDEQPITFGVSIKQRSRWIKGCFQVIKKYGVKLSKKMLQQGSFSCYDMLMNTVPMFVLGVIGLFSNISIILVELLTNSDPISVLITVGAILLNAYFSIWFLGILIAITEHKRINATKFELIKCIMTFPVFVSTYVIAFFVAVFTNVTWAPIPHNAIGSVKKIKSKVGE